MTAYDTISNIRFLLDLLPDVCVTGEHWSDSRVRLVLFVGAHDSLITVTRCAWADCVPLRIEPSEFHWDEPKPRGQDELRYTLDIALDTRTLASFGTRLSKEAYDRGLIELSDHNALSASWKETVDHLEGRSGTT